MRRRIGLTLGLMCVVSLATVASQEAGAVGRVNRREPRAPRVQSQSICASTMYSGPLRGELMVNGVNCVVSEDATIYQIGSGAVPLGTAVRDRMICISATLQGNRTVIHSISLRPLSRPFDGDGSQFVKENTEVDRPQ
jgi:hypothetical protein